MGRKHPTLKSFSYAFEGIREAARKEPNFKIQTAMAVIAIILAVFLGFSRLEWLILVLTISFVLVLELINTVVEGIADIISPEISEKAKIIKDIMAAAVLLSAILAIAVGLVLFLPKII